ncbi:cytochrome P450 [Chytriomyces sp. MP71]|nr:cytochrome P450 [Chytriomyces sp. MP71]
MVPLHELLTTALANAQQWLVSSGTSAVALRVSKHRAVTLATLPLLWIAWNLFVQPLLLSPLLRIPGPPLRNPFSLVGHLPEIWKHEPLVAHRLFVAKFGPIVRFHSTFNVPRVIVASPSGIRHVLGTHAHLFTKDSKFVNTLSGILGVGLLTSNGAVHKRQRAILQPVFKVTTVNKLLPIFTECAHKTREAWLQRISNENQPATTLDVSAELSKTTLDAIGLAGFGYSFNSIAEGESASPLFASFRTMLGLFSPWTFLKYYYLPFLKYVVPAEREFYNRHMEGRRVLQQTCSRIVEEKKADVIAGLDTGSVSSDLLRVLVEANLAADENERLSNKELMAQVNTFLLAGHETTSHALTWALDHLATRPDLQHKLRTEIKHELSTFSSDPPFEYVSSTSTYLDAVMKETLRLSPPAPVTSRVATANTEIDGHAIPRGTLVILSPLVMHTRAEFWGEDAETFRPERWLEAGEEKPFGVYMPFLLGPRNCIGSRFAQLEFKAILAVLLRAFEFERVEGFVYKKLDQISASPEIDTGYKLTPAILTLISKLQDGHVKYMPLCFMSYPFLQPFNLQPVYQKDGTMDIVIESPNEALPDLFLSYWKDALRGHDVARLIGALGG